MRESGCLDFYNKIITHDYHTLNVFNNATKALHGLLAAVFAAITPVLPLENVTLKCSR